MSVKTELWATAFRTGYNANGYTLTNVAAKFGDANGSPANVTATIYSNWNGVNGNGDDRPNSSIITLSGPTSPQGETAVYTCSGSCALSGGTTYHLVFAASGGNGYYRWDATTSDNQTGWTIANGSGRKLSNGPWNPNGNATYSGLFAVYATGTDASLSATSSAGKISLTLSNGPSNWWFKIRQDHTCTAATGTTVTGIGGYTPGTEYNVKAYADSSCNTEIASDKVTVTQVVVQPASLTAGTPTATTNTLTIANHNGNWHYKSTETNASCSSAVSQATANVTGLSTNTSYTFKAYSDSSCATLLATATAFTTANPTLAASYTLYSSATLTLSGWVAGTGTGKDGDWYYKHTTPSNGSCSSAQDSGTARPTGLNGETGYTYAAYSDSGCTTEIATATQFTTPVTPLVSNLAEDDDGRFVVGHITNSSEKWAVGFTTGSNSNGYTLTSIVTKFGAKVGDPGNLTAAIYDDWSPQGKSRPNTLLVTLSGTARPDDEVVTYTCSGNGCALLADTTYHLVFSTSSSSAGNYYQWRATSSDNEFSAAGWTIANISGQIKNPPSLPLHWTYNASQHSGRLAVYATAK